jgi:hypothetical protein
MVHGLPNLSDLEARYRLRRCGPPPYKDGGLVDWSKCDAFCFGLWPFDRPVCFCQRRKGASLQTATCHRSSQPSCGPTLSAGPPGSDPSLRRSVQVWRRLICGDLRKSSRGMPTGSPATSKKFKIKAFQVAYLRHEIASIASRLGGASRI